MPSTGDPVDGVRLAPADAAPTLLGSLFAIRVIRVLIVGTRESATTIASRPTPPAGQGLSRALGKGVPVMGEHSSNAAPTPDVLHPGIAVTDEPAVTLGELLRCAREQRGLTLTQISATTKIPTRHLEALERDDLGVVPGGMYLRAEIRAYADAVGLSREIALGWLHAATAPPVVAEDPAPPPPPVPAPSKRSGAQWRPMVAGLCIATTALVVWVAGRTYHHQAASPGVVSQTRTAAVESVTPPPVDTSPDTLPATGSGRTRDVAPAVAATSGATAASAPDAVSAKHVTAPATPAERPTFEPELDIVTAPAGARVTVDGVGWGTTPVSIRYLPAGSKRLRITRDGFATQERVIDFASDRPRTTVRLTLRPLE